VPDGLWPEDREEYDRAYAAAALAGELAELVYKLRDRAGLTQAELARRMGTTQSSIARIESGGSLPTVEMLARLARAIGISLRLGSGRIPGRCWFDPHPCRCFNAQVFQGPGPACLTCRSTCSS
jgi:DNA-binding XRE family transcriptional regulator